MNKYLPIQFKFNANSFLKLSLLTLSVSLLMGSYTRANAQSVQDEVLSIPPREAYYVEDNTQATSNSPARNSLGNSAALPRVSSSLKNGNKPATTPSSVPGTLNSPSGERSRS